ncbi:hypothetical protein [Paenibacillus alvei]|uniref:Uncharacterized protein n=1 Tax=Paenibacillus alvei TaxID=44250 RepID=A0AAP6ZX84_PAEAL|nr:hypothetical protein [Paenibacillus alvei]NOJ71321.1 hypothetical protein [Paenibacillus alvei]
MKKKYTKVIIFVVVILTIASIVISIDKLSSKKEVQVKSDYYVSFVSSVHTLDMTLAKSKGTELKEDILQMFDVYTTIIFVNDRLTQLKENTESFNEMDELINDFIIFRTRYASLIRQQIVSDSVDPEVLLKVGNQIKLFVRDLPKEYESSKEFSNQLNAADKHIKPLLDISI